MRRAISCLAVLLATSAPAQAQSPDDLPAYRPQQSVSGIIRTWGNENMATLFSYWKEGFRKYHPEVKFEDNLKSSATAIAALYIGAADLGLMGREIWPMETLGFKASVGHEPLEIKITTGAYDVSSKTFPMAVYVNKDNPITGLTLAQLDAIFGSEHLRGAPKNARRWGDVGLQGEWADQPIKAYGYRVDSGLAFFFSQAVLKGSGLWNGELQQFGGQFGSSWDQEARKAVENVGADRYAIAYTGIAFKNPAVKTVALAAAEGEPYFEPTKANVAKRAYPLIRSTLAFINRQPGKPVEPALKEFLRYILSREGQQDVVREGDYIPLTADVVNQQRKKLD